MRKQSSAAPEELNTQSAPEEVRVRRRTQAQRIREQDADAGLTVEYTSFRDRPAAGRSAEESAPVSRRRHVSADDTSDAEAARRSSAPRRGASRPADLTVRPDEDGTYRDEADPDYEGKKHHPVRWIVLVLIILAILGFCAYTALEKPEWAQAGLDWTRGAVETVKERLGLPTSVPATPVPTAEPTPEPTPVPTPEPTVTPSPAPSLEQAAIISVRPDPEVQPDLTQPITFTITTTSYTDRIQVVNDSGKLLLEEDRSGQPSDSSWTVMLYFDDYYEGFIEFYPGNQAGWNDKGSSSIYIKAGEQPEAALPTALPYLPPENAGGEASGEPVEEPLPEKSAAEPTLEPVQPDVTEPVTDDEPVYGRLVKASGEILMGDAVLGTYQSENPVTIAPDAAQAMKGVTNFRGNAARANAAFGTAPVTAQSLEVLWEHQLDGGIGWTGQPLIVQWPSDIRVLMNLYEGMVDRTALKEVIFASVDGNLYFLDLATGEETREAISAGVPLHGTPAVHPAGYPLLIVPMGEPGTTEATARTCGLAIYNLLTRKVVCLIDGVKDAASSPDASFIASPIIDAASSSVVAIGSNGLLNVLTLSPSFDEARTLTLSPSNISYHAQIGDEDVIVDSSPAILGENIYYATDGGILRCVNVNTFNCLWAADLESDTDAAIAAAEDGIYVGTVSGPGNKGHFSKFDPATGELLWTSAQNGSIVSSPVIGTGVLDGMVFFTATRDDVSTLCALSADDGSEIWSCSLSAHTVSSPLAVYGSPDSGSGAWLIQADGAGTVSLIDALSGSMIGSLELGETIVGSPAAFNDTIVIATESGMAYGISLH